MSVDDTALIALTQSPVDGSPVSYLQLYNTKRSRQSVAACQLCPPRSGGGWEEAVSTFLRCRSVALDDVGLSQRTGPIMDMTSERTYSEVNGQINKIVPSGKAYFSTGAAVVDVTAQMFKDILAVQAEFRSKTPKAGHFVGFEIQPTKRVCEVSNSEMAFQSRGPQNNIIIMASWCKEDMDGVDIDDVRKSMTGTKKAIQGDQIKLEPAYGNFGMLQ